MENTKQNKGSKTNPTGVRFDIAKLNFIKEVEKLETPQQVVTFLMEKYWLENKGFEGFKGIIPEILESTAIRVDRQPFCLDDLKKEVQKKMANEKSVQQHMNEIADLQFEDEYKAKWAEIDSATNLTSHQKSILFTNIKASRI